MGREVVFGFLEKLAEDFQNRVGESAKHALAHSMDSQYGRRLKELMEHYTSHPEEASKVSKVQKQVSEVKGVMMDNIEKVLDRGEKIDLLVDKTSNLRSQADTFQRSGRQMRQRMWWQKVKMQLLVALGVVLLIAMLIIIICTSGVNCS